MERDKFQDVTTILFDLDNTLINTKGANRLACDQVIHNLQSWDVRRTIAREIADKFYQLIRESPFNPVAEDTDVDTWRTLLWKQALGPKLSNLATMAYSTWNEYFMKQIRLSQELEDILIGLRKHYKLGLLTNGPSIPQWEKIRKVNGQAYFDVIVVSGDIHHKKPSPAIFEVAFRHLDVSSLQCVMVGDNLDTDIKGGKKANCAATVWVSDDPSPKDRVRPQPDFKISHVRDLVGLLPPERTSFSSLCNEKSITRFHSLRDDVPTWRKEPEYL